MGPSRKSLTRLGGIWEGGLSEMSMEDLAEWASGYADVKNEATATYKKLWEIHQDRVVRGPGARLQRRLAQAIPSDRRDVHRNRRC